MKQSNRPTLGWDRACALILVALAALPRLYQLNLAEFKLDEASHYRMAYFLTRGAWRWAGSAASTGFPKPPLFVYTLALPLALSRDPRVTIGFLGMLAALATGVFYLSLRHLLGRKAAFGAALLFALNPQAILYARKLFTADLLPPLCTLFLVAGIAFLTSPRQRAGRWAAAAAFAFALLALTTLSPLILLPTLGILFWERRRELKLRHWIGAVAALTLPFAPYLAAVTPTIPAALNRTGAVPPSSPPLLDWMWGLLDGSPWPANLLSFAGLAALLLAALSAVGTLFLLNEARKRETGKWARFLLVWVAVCPLLTLVLPITMHPHYLVILYPALFTLPAAGVTLAARKARALGWGAFALLVIIAARQAWSWNGILRDMAAGQYGIPLRYWWDAAEQARALAEQENAGEIILLTPGDRAWDNRAHILDALLSDTSHRVADGATTLVYPPYPAILLISPEVAGPTAPAIPCTQDLHTELPAAPSGGLYRYRLWAPNHPNASLCADALLPADAQWASGARLLGYSVSGPPRPGGTLHVTLHWETTQGPLAADVHWFNHLEDQAGRRWGQLDLVGWPAERWRPGDRVMTHFDLAIAPEAEPGPYLLRVGQYTYPQIENIPILDAAGNPADYAVTLPIPGP